MRCAVVGGAGALGRVLIERLAKCGHEVVNVDLVANEAATTNYPLTATHLGSGHALASFVEDILKAEKESNSGLDGVFCVAGGWSGGAVHDTNAMITSVYEMWSKNVVGATVAAALAPALRKEAHPLILFTSAKASLGATPSMLGYGMAKAATNHLVKSLADDPSLSHATIMAIMPETLDTPANRAAMPTADYSKWTPLEAVADKLIEWFEKSQERPSTGSFVTILTRHSHTTFE